MDRTGRDWAGTGEGGGGMGDVINFSTFPVSFSRPQFYLLHLKASAAAVKLWTTRPPWEAAAGTHAGDANSSVSGQEKQK